MKIDIVGETRSKTFKQIYVQSWSQSSFRDEVRVLVYSLQKTIPLKEGIIELEAVEECELVFSREFFKPFATMIKDLENWLDTHPPDKVEKYMSQIPKEEHLKEWLKSEEDTS